MRHAAVKKASTLVLSVFLVSQLGWSAWAANFTDVSGHWAQQAIEKLSDERVITGYPSGEFRPEGRVTRAEFAAILVRSLGLDSRYTDNGDNFVDVSRSFWGYRPIEIVSDLGLVSGYPGREFRPNQSISRAEAMAILVKGARVPLPSPVEAGRLLSRFGDAGQVPNWAVPAVAAAIESDIFANYPSGNLLEPNNLATRGEVAVMTDRMNHYIATGGRDMGPPSQQPQQAGYGNGYGYSSATQQGNLIRGHIMVVPASTVFSGALTTPLNSESNRVGDPVTVTLTQPILSAAGEIAVPQGSQAHGSIAQIDPAGRAEKNAGMYLVFDRMTTPDGRTFQVQAEVNAKDGMLKGGTTKGRIARTAGKGLGGAAAGAAAGAILGALKSGSSKVDDYLVRGAILGGAIGTGAAVIGKGNEVNIQAGEPLQLRLRQPMNVSLP